MSRTDNWLQLTVIDRLRQTAPESEKQVYCLKLRCERPYQPGDWLLIQPHNPDEVTEQVLELLDLHGDEHVELKRIGSTTAADTLKYHLEITQLDPALLNRLQRHLNLNQWPDRTAMADYARRRSLPDLLCEFPVIRKLGRDLLSLLSPLAPRFYSIASAWEATPGEVHILFRVVQHPSCHHPHPGAATDMLAHLKPGDRVTARIQSNPHFKLPGNPETPIVMLAAGVGLAPFMGFMQARIAQHASGENWLFFGETHREQTFLCRQWLETWQKEGHLNLITAFSRDQAEKCYIQHRMEAHADRLRQLYDDGAFFYLCGDRDRLAPAVEGTLAHILQADPRQLKKAGRFQLDVF